MPYARSITNGTIIEYDHATVYADPLIRIRIGAPPWTTNTMPERQRLVCKPSSTFVIDGHHSWQDFPKAPRPEDWVPAP